MSLTQADLLRRKRARIRDSKLDYALAATPAQRGCTTRDTKSPIFCAVADFAMRTIAIRWLPRGL